VVSGVSERTAAAHQASSRRPALQTHRPLDTRAYNERPKRCKNLKNFVAGKTARKRCRQQRVPPRAQPNRLTKNVFRAGTKSALQTKPYGMAFLAVFNSRYCLIFSDVQRTLEGMSDIH
jgi:hypothetical protein